jgi:hypothetical protein
VDLITAIIDHYQIPPAFVMARLQAVTQVFGTRRLGDKKFGEQKYPNAAPRLSFR